MSIIKKLFTNYNNYLDLQYDDEGLWFNIDEDESTQISNIIYYELGNNITIVDAIAGIGKNTISFSKKFKNVISIELNLERYIFLKNNIKSLLLDNVIIINDHYIKYLNNEYDCYFFDPLHSKNKQNIKLNNTSLLTIINKNSKISRLVNARKIIIIKLPLDYKLNEFQNYNYKIYIIKNYFLLFFR
jgi:16S rRNA G966 N2-methylase RsmD